MTGKLKQAHDELEAKNKALDGTFTASGPVTNLAARIAGQATEGEILVGAITAERIKGYFVLESLGERNLKNVAEPVRLYRVIPPGVYEKVVRGG